MRSRSSLINLAILGVCLAAGYAVASSQNRDRAAKQPAPSALSATVEDQKPVPDNSEAAFASRLDGILDSLAGPGKLSYAERIEAIKSNGELEHIKRMALYDQWIEKDPIAAFAFILKRGRDEELMVRAIDAWARTDVRGMIAAVENAKINFAFEGSVAVAAAKHLARIDPKAAADFVRTWPIEDIGYGDFFQVLAAQDRQMALALAAELPAAGCRVIGQIYGQWATDEPAQAFDALKEVNDVQQRRSAMEEAVKIMFKEDPELAMAHFSKAPLIGMLTSRVMEAWIAHNPASALEFAQSLDHPYRRGALWSYASHQDSGIDDIRSIALSSEDRELTSHAFSRLAQRDWDVASEALYEIEDANLRRAAFEGFSKGLAGAIQRTEIDGHAWIEPMMELAAEHGTKTNLPWVVPSLSPEDVGTYIEKFGSNFADAIAGGVAKIAESDPVTAAAMITHFPESRSRDEIIQPMVANWSMTDPDSAAAWVEQLAGGPGRETAIRNIANSWTRYTPADAWNWIEHLPAGPDRELAAAEFAKIQAVAAPAEAQSALDLIVDPIRRQRSELEVLLATISSNPGRAAEMLEGIQLNEEYRQNLEKQIARTLYWRQEISN